MCTTLVNVETNETVFTFLSEFCKPWAGQTIIEVFILSLTFLLALAGNFMVLAAIVRNPKLQSATTVFICNLAVTDLLFAMGIPFIAATRISQHWMLGDVICKAVTYIQFVAGVCSILTMVLISVDRYVRICLNNRYKFEKCQLSLALIVLWLISGAFPVPVAISQTVKTIETRNELFSYCGVEWSTDFHAEIYFIVMIACFFLGPLVAVTALYVCIWRTVQHSSTRAVSRTSRTSHHSDKFAEKQVRLVKMFSSIVILFVIMWLPFFILSFLGVHFKQITSTHFTITLILALINTCQNPVIYGYFNYKFRHEFKTICCQVILRQKRASSAYVVGETELGNAECQNSSTLT